MKNLTQVSTMNTRKKLTINMQYLCLNFISQRFKPKNKKDKKQPVNIVTGI
jgi:hypothetical protein